MNHLFESGELTPGGERYTHVDNLIRNSDDCIELILLKEGGARPHSLFYEMPARVPVVIYIPQGVKDRFIPDENARGYVIRFKHEFLPANKVDLFTTFFEPCRLPLASFALEGTVMELFKMILCEYVSDCVDASSIQYLLLSLLAKLDFVRKNMEKQMPSSDRDYVLCKELLRLLDLHYADNHKVDFYSRQLNISLRTLNYATARVLGKSVLQLVDMRKHTEARHLLVNSSKSIAEIAQELGYDKSYFSRFFLKKTGMTPMQFRQIALGVGVA